MLIGLTGPVCSGKSVVAQRLEQVHNFTHISLTELVESVRRTKHEASATEVRTEAAGRIINLVTKDCLSNYVVTGITQLSDIHLLRRRPCTVIVGVDAPFIIRYGRYRAKRQPFTPVGVCPSLCIGDAAENRDKHSNSRCPPGDAFPSLIDSCADISNAVDTKNSKASLGDKHKYADSSSSAATACVERGHNADEITASVQTLSDFLNKPPVEIVRMSPMLQAASDRLAFYFTGSQPPPSLESEDLLSFAALDARMNYRTTAGSEYVVETAAAIIGPLEHGGDLIACTEMCDIKMHNGGALSSLFEEVDKLPVKGREVIRPSWDVYFMRLAFLASSRANCLKRRVGALIVRENRTVATGYNGTASGTQNCNEGGCERCREVSIAQGQLLETCVCIHAEANALLEAGRDRAVGGVLYCTTMPCLACAKLAVQAGIKRVVYAQPYAGSEGSLSLLKKGGVQVDCYGSMPTAVRLGAVNLFMPPEPSA